MKFPCLLTAALLIAGCTSMQPIDGSLTDLRERINSGELLKAGDRVLIVTADQKGHRFTVKSVGAGHIDGPSESIPVEQISAVEKRQFSRTKTAALVIGMALAGTVLGLSAYAATHLTVGF